MLWKCISEIVGWFRGSKALPRLLVADEPSIWDVGPITCILCKESKPIEKFHQGVRRCYDCQPPGKIQCYDCKKWFDTKDNGRFPYWCSECQLESSNLYYIFEELLYKVDQLHSLLSLQEKQVKQAEKTVVVPGEGTGETLSIRNRFSPKAKSEIEIDVGEYPIHKVLDKGTIIKTNIGTLYLSKSEIKNNALVNLQAQ